MKTKFFSILFITLSLISYAQSSKTITVGGLEREYLEFKPSTYMGNTPVPLIICLHGLGDNMTNFSHIGIQNFADSAQFITLYPQAWNSSYGTAWNSGASIYGIEINPTIDDIGFINALIDSAAKEYNIDLSRVFAIGFSMGGFMSNRLACQLGNRICAIASVAGTIGNSCQCNPTSPIAVAHFHGTKDKTVAYVGNSFGKDPEDLVKFWTEKNNCTIIPIHIELPNTATDSIIVDIYKYLNGKENTEVWFYKINGADHVWLYEPINDITYTKEIWNFLKKFKKQNTSKKQNISPYISIFPNPAKNNLQINGFNGADKGILRIIDLNGKTNITEKFDNSFKNINVSKLKDGVYVVELISAKKTLSTKVIILK